MLGWCSICTCASLCSSRVILQNITKTTTNIAMLKVAMTLNHPSLRYAWKMVRRSWPINPWPCKPNQLWPEWGKHFGKFGWNAFNGSRVIGFPLYFGIKIQGLFKDPEVAFSRTNSRRKFTAWTVLKQHVISISVIRGQFWLIKTKRNNY